MGRARDRGVPLRAPARSSSAPASGLINSPGATAAKAIQPAIVGDSRPSIAALVGEGAIQAAGARVEFAIRLPGQGTGTMWLPIDAKFPAEAYQRLAVAAERGDLEAVDACSRELETVIRTCARTFSNKYLAPPATTDFGILFLATEGLYAEALRRPGLAEALQNQYRVVLAGPTTFAALLNSLQMGFKTLAIQQRSGEVWKILGEVKTQFGKYSQVLATIRKRLDQATQTVDDAAIRTRAIEKRLRSVETPEEAPAAAQLRLVAGSDGN